MANIELLRLDGEKAEAVRSGEQDKRSVGL